MNLIAEDKARAARQVDWQDRFWSKVNKAYGCWIWTGGKTGGNAPDGRYGYPYINGRHEYAHRVSYVLSKGNIPKGYQIDHLCRNRLCVNPDHLEAVTQRENLLRGTGVSSQNAIKTTCPIGHPLSGENIRWTGKNRRSRSCRTCLNARKRVGSKGGVQ